MNGLTRAGGKHLQVMPDGSLTVTQEARLDGKTISREYEVGIKRMPNRVVPQKYNVLLSQCGLGQKLF